MQEAMPALIRMQKGEITEHFIYQGLAGSTRDSRNKKILEQIANDELRHYNTLKETTKLEFKPNIPRIWWYTFLGRAFGLSFALKLMEGGEAGAQKSYSALAGDFPKVADIIKDEEAHESKLIDLISEERLEYASSIVLGLNDALVELTGALAGLTLAFQNGKFIAVSGFIIGVAAALSMAASSYLSAREEGGGSGKSPRKSALYTGTTYILTVLLLILPYFLFDNVYAALAAMISLALLVVAAYTFYISTAKSRKFLPRFLEMAAISLTVAAISYGVGYLARVLFGLAV